MTNDKEKTTKVFPVREPVPTDRRPPRELGDDKTRPQPRR